MKKLDKMKCYVCEELDGATQYAEKYIEMKAAGNTAWANKFREMANDELNHAKYMYDWFNEQMNDIKKVYELSEGEEDEEEHLHKKYADKVAHVKHMLTM